MTDTGDLVNKVIERDAAIKRDLGRGIVNVRALARLVQLTPEGKGASLDAIISSIRRYPIEEAATSQKKIEGLLKRLTMKNGIVDVAILNESEIPGALGKFSSLIDYSRGETFRIVAGVELIRVVIDEKNLGKLTGLIPKKSIKRVTNGLAEIIISMPEVAEYTPGVVSTVTTELMMHGINMIEFMSCVPELIIVVDEKDALRSYDALDQLSKGSL